MSKYSKDELLKKSEAEVQAIAEQFGINPKNSTSVEDLVYQILDEQAVQSSIKKPATKRRARIVKKEADRVYSASKDHGENVEKKNMEQGLQPSTAVSAKESSAEPSLAEDSGTLQEPNEESLPKRKRGRPRKTQDKQEENDLKSGEETQSAEGPSLFDESEEENKAQKEPEVSKPVSISDLVTDYETIRNILPRNEDSSLNFSDNNSEESVESKDIQTVSQDLDFIPVTDIPVIEEEAAYYSYFTIPLGAVIRDDCMITVCLKDTAVMRDFARGRIRNFATFKKTRFLFQILYNLASKYLAYLKQIDKASQRIQNELHKSTRNKELIRMLDLENSLVYFSTSLTGNDAVITRLLSGKNLGSMIKMYEEDKDLLEDVAVETKQAMEMCSIYRDILSGTMDAYASVISNNLNIIMKILTSVTLVISVPTLIASFWGMNTGVPLEGKPWGFWVVLAISVAISAILALFLHKKKLL